MAGLVPAIHVVVQLYITRLSGCVRTLRKEARKPLALLAFNHVDGRDEPGHDGADRFDYFAASPNTVSVALIGEGEFSGGRLAAVMRHCHPPVIPFYWHFVRP
jgi:hypothetical protein